MNKSIEALLNTLGWSPEYRRLAGALRDGEGPASVFGLGDAHKSHTAAALFRDTGKTVLLLSASEASAARLNEDISPLLKDAAHFPARDMPLKNRRDITASGGLSMRRLETLGKLCAGEPMLLTASATALLQRLAPPEALVDAGIALETAYRIQPKTLVSLLVRGGYERVDICEGRGQVCLRGGYVDVFPATAQAPVRVEFFDDEIDTLREYDPLTQRSTERVERVFIPPATELPLDEAARVRGRKVLKGKKEYSEEYEALSTGGTPRGASLLLPLFYPGETCLLDYLPKDAVILIDEPLRFEESAKVAYTEFMEGFGDAVLAGEALPEQASLMNAPSETIRRLEAPRTAMFFALTRSYGLIAPKVIFRFETRPATRYQGREETLVEDMASWRKNGTTALIYAGAHAKRLQDRLGDMDELIPAVDALERDAVRGEIIIIGQGIAKGFEYPEIKLAVISETELYGETTRKSAARSKRPQLVFSELEVGDLVVHELHGIGRFSGVETLNVGDASRDYLLLTYSGGDKLYIPTDQLDRVQKYIGGEENAKLSKLGNGEWQKTVSRTRESVKRLAFDLVELYAERHRKKGFQFSPDGQWQKRLEESFPYEETPDQLVCIEEIKHDMESDHVMDRLLCGDVGYGKTEVALRACFKAVMDGKQAAVLVPTTILAQQHYNTLSARFSGFPVEVALLSRFSSPAEEKKTLERLEEGHVDVVVGTHKLLSKSVKFHNLGLLVVDEEQRFGVGHKEQIKNIKRNVDVLTLSATPIPRTLHMSMAGIRDMSVLDTPPEQRYPVQTYVMEYDDGVVREAILKELGRDGQAYIVYNRVRDMERFAGQLRALVPDARIACAHGQMQERMLEKTMLDFMEGQYDVLLCSTIIENGLDIPNVNTIIICDADRMGLSQLYQLRGRVGRSARLGYAYFTFRRDKALNETAEKRLEAIREFTQFGSGFKIAMRDLEIRGAGNILGPEQHGHMAAVGYDLYCKIVSDAVKEAKGEPVKRDMDTVMEIPIPASIPHGYIPRETDRLSMYKRIALLNDQDDMYDVQDELIDRYGEIPKPVQNLLRIALLKSEAGNAYITRVMVREGEAQIAFDPTAPMDVSRLYEAVGSIEGAQLKAKDAPMLVIKRKNAAPEAIAGELPQIVHRLKDCIRA